MTAETLIQSHAALWYDATHHSFLDQVRDGTLAPAAFARQCHPEVIILGEPTCEDGWGERPVSDLIEERVQAFRPATGERGHCQGTQEQQNDCSQRLSLIDPASAPGAMAQAIGAAIYPDGGGGASTSRAPLDCSGPMTPDSSICSSMRAARL